MSTKKPSPFDFVRALSDSKENLFIEFPKEYVPFIINKAFSFGKDTVLYANEMNRLWHMDKEWQHQFYLTGLRRGRRYNKWLKATENPRVKAIQEAFGYSRAKAAEVMSLLDEETIEHIQHTQRRGGPP